MSIELAHVPTYSRSRFRRLNLLSFCSRSADARSVPVCVLIFVTSEAAADNLSYGG
jgi:hypothetical protein